MSFSEKQKKIFDFADSDYDALICDGSVRSGKTSCMSFAFVLWAVTHFNNRTFAICGKSVGSVERNVVQPLMAIQALNTACKIEYSRSNHMMTVSARGRKNYICVFGGKDESSYMLIQGITLAGVLLDEVALMPRSFVEQALARCSVSGAKMWFNCNPENPMHWFRQEWILQPEKHNVLHLHFLMDDNPGLDEKTKNRFKSMYSGVFYERYILGRWVMAEGLIYDMFDPSANIYADGQQPIDMIARSTRTIACDYGTRNPTVFLDIYDDGEKVRVHREYRWDSRKEARQKTDEEYADDFMRFMGDTPCMVIVDPAATSFIVALRQRGVYVMEANNDVIPGIRRAGNLLARRDIVINQSCAGLIDELETYRWDDKAALSGVERPIKEADHAPDALRYYINYLPDWRFE